MHPNPVYRQESNARHLHLARERAFGTLAVNAEGGPLLSHVPFLLSDDGTSADLHLVRSNPIARLGSVGAVIAVAGADGYISPDWYRIEDQVPTWNYVAVHLRGSLDPLPPETLPDVLRRQSAAYEARLAPKPAWTLDKLTEETMSRFFRMILPFRMTITDVQGTWKLSQNKTEDARLGAAASVESGFGQELASLAALMRDANAGD